MEKEHWRKINDFPGYQVSDKGNVRSKKSCGIKKDFNKEYKEMTKHKTHKGYLVVHLRKDNKCYNRPIHRLVLSSFKPVKNSDKLQVDHLDLNKENNHLSNLEWVTPKENIKRAIKNNKTGHRFTDEQIRMGSESRKKKIIAMNDGSKIKYNSLTEAASDLNVDIRAISAILNKRQKYVGKDKWHFEYDN